MTASSTRTGAATSLQERPAVRHRRLTSADASSGRSVASLWGPEQGQIEKVVSVVDRATPVRNQADAVNVERISVLHWRAWSLALANPRDGLTEHMARRRIQADLDYEWRTGRVRRGQRRPS